MRRVLFQFWGINIYSYPAMLYLGLVAGVFLGAHLAPQYGLSADQFTLATMILIAPALIGARLYFVFQHWAVYRHDLRRIWRRGDSGAALYGGLLVIVPLSYPLLRVMRVPFAAFWDAAIFTMLLGMAFTRIGCLLNGCCGGRATTSRLGVYLPDDHGIWRRRIPTQPLEAIFALLLLAGAAWCGGSEPFHGAIFLFVVLAYGTWRFALEAVREEGEGSIAIRLTSALLVMAALAGIMLAWRR